MILIGYLFTIINYICYCLSRFMRRKKMILFIDLLSKIFAALGLYCFGSLSGAYITVTMFFILIAANIKEHLNKRYLWGYVAFQGICLGILCCTYEGVSSILVVLTVSITLFSVWWLPPQQMRLIGGINGITYMAYLLSIKNWAGFLEVIAISSNFLSYLKYKKIGDK